MTGADGLDGETDTSVDAALTTLPDWVHEALELFAPDAAWPVVRLHADRPRAQVLSVLTYGNPPVIDIRVGRPVDDLRRSLAYELARLRLMVDKTHGRSLSEELAFMEHELALDHSEIGEGGCDAGERCLGDLAREFKRGEVVRLLVDGAEVEGLVGDIDSRLITVLSRDTLQPLARVGHRFLARFNPRAQDEQREMSITRLAPPPVKRPLKNPCPVPAADGSARSHRWEVVPGSETPRRLSSSGKAEYNERDQVCRACGLAQQNVPWSRTLTKGKASVNPD